MIGSSSSLLLADIVLTATTAEADKLVNLARERGLTYTYVDGAGKPLSPQDFGDTDRELRAVAWRIVGASLARAGV